MSNFLDCINDKISEGLLTAKQVKLLENRYNKLKGIYQINMSSNEAAIKAALNVTKREADKLGKRKRNSMQQAIRWDEIQKDIIARKKIDPTVDTQRYAADLMDHTLLRQNSVREQLTRNLEEFATEFKVDFFEIKRNIKGIRDVVKVALGEVSDDIHASRLGKAVKETFSLAHGRLEAAGGVLGKIENYFPISHKRDAIIKVTSGVWVDYIMPRLDRTKMISEESGLPISKEKLRKLLEHHYEDIKLGRTAEMDKKLKDGIKHLHSTGPDIASRKDVSRFYKFKDADSFLEYNEKFGSGDKGLYTAITGYVSTVSNDIAMLEMISPDPHLMYANLEAKMKSEGSSSIKVQWTRGAWDVVNGNSNRWEGIPSKWYMALQTGTAWLRATQLGAATLSAFSDVSLAVATAKAKGIDSFKIVGAYGKLMNPFSAEDRALGRRAGMIADYVLENSLSDTRFAGEQIEGGKVVQWMSSMTNKLSLLDSHTKSVEDSMTIAAEFRIADNVKAGVKWENVEYDLKEGLKAYNINESDWEKILRTDLYEVREGEHLFRTMDISERPEVASARADEIQVKMEKEIEGKRVAAKKKITELEVKKKVVSKAFNKLEKIYKIIEINADKNPGEVRDLYKREMKDLREGLKGIGISKRDPDTILKELRKFQLDVEEANQAFKGASSELENVVTSAQKQSAQEIFNESRELASKVNDWLFHLRQLSTNSPTAMARSLSTGFGARKGTPQRTAAMIGMMYKSFSVTMLLSQLMPAIKRAKTLKKYDQLGILLIGGTALGGLSLAAKDISKGREPRKLDAKYLLAAMAQGGGLGMLGDFIFADESRYGGGFMSTLGGPAVGLASDILKVTKGNVQKDISNHYEGKTQDVGYLLSAFKVAKRNIPVARLWYTRLLIERLLLDNMERLLDPKFDARNRKQENKFYRKTGQKNFWKKGKMIPFK